MSRNELIKRAQAILAEAYEEAAYLIAEYLDRHPSESPKALCQEIDPDNWNALRCKVQRAQGDRKSNRGADSSSARAIRRGKAVLRGAEPNQLREIMDELPPQQRAAIVRAAIPPPDQSTAPRTGPTFIELIVRVSSTLIELEAMVAGWQNPAAVPPEFSRDSFSDVVQKVLRIQDHFDRLVDAVDDENEFQKIVRSFRVTNDVG